MDYGLVKWIRLNVRFNMQSCVHSFFFFAQPTDPPSREGGRWETKHFIGMALLGYSGEGSMPDSCLILNQVNNQA